MTRHQESGPVNGARSDAFQRDGFYVHDEPLLPADLVTRANEAVARVVAGEYETGRPPRLREWFPGDSTEKLVKIAEPHRCDRTLQEVVTHPAIAALTAELASTTTVQVWAVDLLVKHPSREAHANVGWHQDGAYFSYWAGDLISAWISLSDVTEHCGPVRYVVGSHRLGLIGGDFYANDLEGVRRGLELPAEHRWDEVSAVLPPGGVAFHHHMTVHGSGANVADHPRTAIVLRMRTDHSRLLGTDPMPAPLAHLDDPVDAPVTFRAGNGA